MTDVSQTTRARTSSDEARAALIAVRHEVAKAVVGQDAAVSGILIALLSRGHILLEGVPGVAKTLLIRAVAAALDVQTKRVQFTPDLMPGDITGSLIYDPHSAEFSFREGPVFTNLLLADEINRTPPKTQAALLESMEERQVSVDGAPRMLPSPVMVAATQNPVEYEGTYPLPEAQLDRFLLKVELGLGQRVGAFVLDRVLGGGDHEWRRQHPGCAVDGDLALLHGLQQCGLCLGWRPVDLVGEQQVGEYRPFAEGELGTVRVVDQRSGDVARHQVRGELHPFGLDVQRRSNRADEQGLGDAGHALEQDVSATQQRDEDAGHCGVLSHDRLGDLVADGNQRGPGLIG